jgi:hypothetical protein
LPHRSSASPEFGVIVIDQAQRRLQQRVTLMQMAKMG